LAQFVLQAFVIQFIRDNPFCLSCQSLLQQHVTICSSWRSMFGQCGIFHLIFTLKEVKYTQENCNTATGRKFNTSKTLCEVEISEDSFMKAIMFM
jgi:hypothetical protein